MDAEGKGAVGWETSPVMQGWTSTDAQKWLPTEKSGDPWYPTSCLTRNSGKGKIYSLSGLLEI